MRFFRLLKKVNFETRRITDIHNGLFRILRLGVNLVVFYFSVISNKKRAELNNLKLEFVKTSLSLSIIDGPRLTIIYY